MSEKSTDHTEKHHLPPREFWLDKNQNKEKNKIPTPTDELGLIDVEQLYEDIKNTIKPEYEWRQTPKNDHHLYWPKKKHPYKWRSENEKHPRSFRNLPFNLKTIPKEFHDYLHEITIPPKPPSKEVMQQITEAFCTVEEAREMVFLHQLAEQETEAAAGHTKFSKKEIKLIQAQSLEDIEGRKLEKLSRIQDKLGHLAIFSELLRQPEIKPEEATPERIARLLGKIAAPDTLDLNGQAA